ncbi:hypothetical protein L873DRAFT_1781287 [Choiromyces venosus 120613-1]|uniref:Smr domain-containing protein n=1 Tax=Choiromyces venosus 120613-1 TaxID=1336337 RepID=A0A3N4J4E9_9PEZI|nr:hypothetical protein L873DRAFT_1781287 [Choiromyces venosus 120613-1]
MSGSGSPQSQDDYMATYDRLRAPSSEAQARHIAFTASHNAYASGDRALAHTLSQRGKQHGNNMKAYNAQAKNFIFDINNANLPDDTVDLHGLYVDEAMDVLRWRIQDIWNEGLWVIVGRGSHSAGGARLGPAVQRFCREVGVQAGEGMMEGRLYLY